MTYTTIAATGRGRLIFFLRISGFPWVLATANYEPNGADTWYWNGAARRFTGVKPWLAYSGLEIDERADIADGTLEVGSLSIEVVDVDGGFTALLGASQYRTFTRLATDITAASAGPLAADGVSGFAAGGGVIWIDQEAIAYDHTDTVPDPDEFHVLTRGYYGTIATAHTVSTTYSPVVIPIITDGCTVLGGRRANIYAAEISDAITGSISASECIYRGIVGTDCDVGEGVYRLRIDHITSMWSRKVGQRLPRATLRPGYCYTGGALSTVVITEQNAGTGATINVDCTIVAGYYSPGGAGSQFDAAVSTAFNGTQAASLSSNGMILAWIFPAMERLSLFCEDDATYTVSVDVQEGDYLWACGFDPGHYERRANAGDVVFEAQNDPRLFVAEIAKASTSTTEMQCEICDVLGIEDGHWATLGQSPALKVQGSAASTITEGDQHVTFEYGIDPVHSDVNFIAIENEDELVFQHVVFASSSTETIATALQKFLGVYVGTGFPAQWVLSGLEADDFDWTELTAALVGLPIQLQGYYDCIKEPITVGELICDRLGLAGIVPRLTGEGRIGFVKACTPHASIASTIEVDSAMWSIMNVAKVKTQIEGIPRLTQVKIESNYDYRTGQWGTPISIMVDGINTLGKTISKDYRARGLIVSNEIGTGLTYTTFASLLEGVKTKVLGTHLGLLGRGGPTVGIPCTWTDRQLKIGDVVLVTHPGIHDVAAGAVGVTDRLGIVIGRHLRLTDQGEDVLQVLLPPETNAGIISPSCHADDWHPLTLTLDIDHTGNFARTGENDLTYFEAGQSVRFIEYDVAAPGSWGPANIDSVGANEIVLDADPFGGAFPATGVIVFFSFYDECTPDQKIWLFIGDTAYGLGAAPDEAYVWSM